MQKKRSRPFLYLLGAVLLASVVFYLERPDKSPVDSADGGPLFPKLKTEEIAQIDIEHLTNGVRLTRAGDVWRVARHETALEKQVQQAAAQEQGEPQSPETASKSDELYNADPVLIQGALSTLRDLRVGAVASRNAEMQTRLQVKGVGLQIIAYDAAGKKLVHLFVGKQGPDVLSTYVRREGEDDVYLVKEMLRGKFAAQAERWRDRTVWNLDPDQMTSVTVERRAGNFTLTKNAEGRFELTSPKQERPLNVAKLQGWFGAWKEIKAVEFPEGIDLAKVGLEKPQTKIIATMKDGTIHSLIIGLDAEKGGAYGQLEGKEVVYVLPTSVRNAINTKWDDWLTDSQET